MGAAAVRRGYGRGAWQVRVEHVADVPDLRHVDLAFHADADGAEDLAHSRNGVLAVGSRPAGLEGLAQAAADDCDGHTRGLDVPACPDAPAVGTDRPRAD